MDLNANRTPIGGTPIAPADPKSSTRWQALWLRDPLFDGVARRDLIDSRRRTENNGAIQNIHTLFRREFTLDDRPLSQARLYITADDCYKLYVNGTFVGTGPAPAYPWRQPYNAWDVTPFLNPGTANCIGVHTFYHGMHSLTFPSGDNLQGLLVQLEIDGDPTAQPFRLVSDETWRCRQLDAYESRHVIGYQTAFSEFIDMRKLAPGWNRTGYEDRDWSAPLAGPVPDIYALSPQQTPPVAVFRRRPERILRKADGHYFIDFGSELTGETVFLVSGAAGHEVEIRHGEELQGPDTVRYDMRCNCLYQEVCTLAGRRDDQLEFFDFKAFRYVEVLNWPEALTPDRIWAHERHYPFPDDASRFHSANPLLDDIWKLCRNGVRVGTLDTYLDCPTREKGGFMGDGFVTGTSHLVLTGDARILRKFLGDVASTGRFCPGLHSTAPNYVNGELAEYSLLWPVLLEYYYQWTGDLAFVREMMPVLETMLDYYTRYANDDGLLQDVFSHQTKRYSILVDWPGNLRDDYDDPYLMGDRTVPDDPVDVINTMVQGFYGCALDASARLAERADSAAVRDLVAGRAEQLRNAVLTRLRHPETGLFIDRNGSDHSALHANVTPLMAGMLPPEERTAAVDLIREKRLSCGVYFSYFVLKALYDAGESQLAYELITSRDLHSWHSMLEAGATTCMEAWAPDLKWNTSWCHPWSSAPVPMIAHELMGLRPATPGWREIRFAPHPPAGLESASIALTIPPGRLEAAFRQEGRTVTCRLTVPAGCTARCLFPGAAAGVTVDGADAPCRRGRDKNQREQTELEQPVGPGSHTISLRM